MPVIRDASQIDAAWLSAALNLPVVDVEVRPSSSSWATHLVIRATLVDGSTKALWLKMCLGETFGTSEVDYYTSDYVGVEGAPLVRCHDACFEQGVGYHVLLDDLSETHCDRKALPPTLEHGLAIAEALAVLHRAHWESQSPDTQAIQRYLNHIRLGLERIEQATDRHFSAWFEEHAIRMTARWANPVGQTLLHGDANPTNVMTPKEAEAPVYLLDRQPFDWSLIYGLAAFDLAYATVPWWAYEFRKGVEPAILRRWYEALDGPDYAWEQAQEDWDLSVEQCLHVPIEWCCDPDDMERMRGLWQWELGNITGVS